MASNLDRTLAFIASWSRIDLEAILAEMAPDCFYHNVPWEPFIGHDAIRAGLQSFMSGAEAIDWQVRHAAEDSQGAVLTERLDRFLIGGKWIEIPVMGTFEWENGKIVRWRDYFDSAQFAAAMAVLG